MGIEATNTLKVLLLQIRHEERVRDEEYASFCQFSGLNNGEITIHNVFDQPDFEPLIIDGYHGLFIGGASEASVLEPDNYPFVDNAIKLIQYSIEKSIPVFASCFGFQLAVLALGGTIIRDEKGFEMGSLPIQLTEAALKDTLFWDTPNNFHAVAVHRERSLSAPEGCIPLAYTDQCSHAFRVEDKPFWAFQFHPEVDKKVLVERLTIYKSKYTENDDHLDEVLANAIETPESNDLLLKFTERVLKPLVIE